MKINLLELIDFEDINKLLEGFNQSTGFVTAILDLEGNILSKSGWRQICTEFHRVNPETSRNCRISDTILANELRKGEKYHFYKCHNGLVDVAVPLLINGEHIANLFSGQFFFTEPDRNFFIQQAKNHGFNEQEYIAALKKVPIIPEDKVKVAMDFLLNMTQLISEITFQKMELLQLNTALQVREKRSRNVLDQMLEGCQIIGYDWRYLYLNNSAEIHNRRPNHELLGNRYMDIWPGIEHSRVFKIIKQALEERISSHFENEFAFSDGSFGWFDLSIQPIPEGVFILSIDITERKIAENAQHESDFRFNRLYETGPFGMVMADKDFRFKKANPAFCSILGYTETELQEFTFKDISHPDDLKKDLVNVQNLINKEVDTYRTNKRYIRKDGQIIWGSLTVTVTLDKEGQFLYYLGIIEDITRRKLLEESLQSNEARLRNIFEQANDGIYIINADNQYIDVNEKGLELLGCTKEELLRLNVADVLHPDEVARLAVEPVIMMSGVPHLAEWKHIRKDGTPFPGEVSARRLNEHSYLAILRDLTERKNAENEIRRLNERIATATKSARVGIWDWDVKQNLLVWDDQMYALYGLNKDEFSGAYNAWLKGLHPDDRDFCQNAVTLALQGTKEYDIEFRVIWPDGRVRYCKARGEVFRDETGEPVRMVGVNVDITEQKLNDEKIREKDLEFRKLSANVPDLIFQFTRKTDGTYCVPIASEGIRNIFGCSPEDVIDDFTPIGRVIYPEDAERVIRDIEYSAEHLTYFTCEFRVQIPGREIQWIYSKSTPEKLPDGSITWYGFNTDITQQKQIEEILEQRVRERTAQLELANKELEAFSYSVSHDLRAPLRHINGYVDLLNDRFQENLPEKARHYLTTVSEASKQMGTLIDDLLQFSRTGRQDLHKEKLDMNGLIHEVLDKIKQDVKHRNIIWSVQDLPEVSGDYSLLKQVWVNLLDNAVKYTRLADSAQISVECREEKDKFVFSIRDNGVGFDMKYAHKLFGVFQRLHAQSDFEGTGIGLANVQRIVHKHHGSIWAEAEPDKGATFFFTLPKK